MNAKLFKISVVSFFSLMLLILAGCGGSDRLYKGQLYGVPDRPSWHDIIPHGMVYVPSGSLHVGPSDENVNKTKAQRAKQISIHGFYIDDTEISNNEYRQFVYWVRDSIAKKMIGEKHLIETKTGTRLDWTVPIKWEQQETKDILAPLYYKPEDRIWGKKVIDKSKLNYKYEWVNYDEAAKRKNKDKARSEFLKEGVVNVYPDTLVWVRDYTYSYNEPMTRKYFWHPAYDNYPVVGVTWEQARAFSIWRTRLWNTYRRSLNKTLVDNFRLPYEYEWEYAARGGKKGSPYPWGGPYMRNAKGCILANFKPNRGNYTDDGGFYTVDVHSYFPNDYGIYNMAGNVAEWTATSYTENMGSFMHDLNSDYRAKPEDDDPKAVKRKVIRGGSWKDIAYFCQTGTRTFEYMDTAKCYVGFRCSMTFLGRSLGD